MYIDSNRSRRLGPLLTWTAAAALFAAPLVQANHTEPTEEAAAQAQPAAAAPQGGGPPAQGRRGQPPEGRQGQPAPGRQGGRGRQAGPAIPPPRLPNGRVSLTGSNAAGSNVRENGLWLPTIGITTPLAPPATIPFQPWAAKLYADRQLHELEPHTRCKASGVSRPFQTPYGVEFVELPDLQRIYIFDVGGPHTYRTVYMDGRTHPQNGPRLYYGHSVGWWEGDTLVIETTNFNESFWLDRRGVPHTEQLRTLEKFTRTALATIKYEVTIDDPGAYTRPWNGGFDLRWETGTELFEYVCQQANYAHELMVGTEASVDRSTTIVP
jgi:hypothetical protein